MLKTFKAILKNNRVEWVDETPEINPDNSVKVHVTVLEETIITEPKSNGQKMSEALSKIANKNIFSDINPQKWQREIRQDRPLPNRD